MSSAAEELAAFTVTSRTSWADLAAFCYARIDDLEMPEGEFLSRYCSPAPAPNAPVNPNLKLLQRFAGKVCQVASDEMRLHTTSRPKALEQVTKLASSLALAPYGIDACNAATPFWAIISGIDMAYEDSFSTIRVSRRGPLNVQVEHERLGIYLKPLDSVIMHCYRQKGIALIPEDDLNNQLRALLVMKRRDNRCMPEIRLASRRSSQGDPSASERPVIRIGLCLFSAAKMFDFERDDLPIVPDFRGGSAYTVRYSPGYVKRCMDVVRPSIDAAIENGCDVLAFPEYVMSPESQAALSRYLEGLGDRGRLALVVAGSGWTDDDNNVCVLYRPDGKEVGRYYKASSFVSSDGRYRELLSTPGAECIVTDIVGIGRVLPSICKDFVSDNRYTLDLAHSLHPQLICAPAFSESLDRAFSDSLRNAAERSLSIGCVCNCCGACRANADGSVEPTIYCVPQAKKRDDGSISKQADAKPMYVSCDSVRRGECTNSFSNDDEHGCLRIIEIDFAESDDNDPWPCVTLK